MSEPQVFLNGKKIGNWGYGYSYFSIDITNDLLAGSENVLAVKLTNLPFSSRWYPGAGLYRKVSIVVNEEESFTQWGTFITTPDMKENNAVVDIKAEFHGSNVSMETQIKDLTNNIVATQKSAETADGKFHQIMAVANPNLWSPETPYLYTAVTKLYLLLTEL